MGIISKGILGGFSGKVGNVIGASWKGIQYMRSLSNYRNTNPSEAQLVQQKRFGLTIGFLQPLTRLLEISFRNYAVKMSGINNALAFNIKNAIAGVYPALELDYSLALISRGELPNALSPSTTMGASGQLTFSWTDNTGIGSARANDQAILVAYCPGQRQAVYVLQGTSRSDMAGTLDISAFVGMEVHTWIGFISENGRNVASSIYTGQVIGT